MNTATENKTIDTYVSFIKATPEAIWEALIQPEWSVRYGYAPINQYDLRPGGTYRALATEEMKQNPACPDVLCDGEVLEVEPNVRLVQTWRMLMMPDLEAEGFTRLSYEIQPVRGGVTKLTITHDLTGAPSLRAVVSGAYLEHGGGGGWNEIISGLKTLLETGTQLPSLSGPA